MIKTAEAVSPAHPDKMADQIADYALTEILKIDPASRVALEVVGGHGHIYVVGEVSTTISEQETFAIIRRATDNVLALNRYNPLLYEGHINLIRQSPDIARGVDTGGAGDQGIMVGYACADNKAMIPQELFIAREILKEMWDTIENRDAKSQVTIEDGVVKKVVVSAEGKDGFIIVPCVMAVLERHYGPAVLIPDMLINPAGPWDDGGFAADTGLTGRKIAYDNYGPQVEIGGGCFSGKDPSKVDRSGAYMARKVAVGILNSTMGAKEVKVKVAYAIGVAKPVMVSVQIDGGAIEDCTEGYADRFTPANMIEELGLRSVDYFDVARWGSFGHSFPWDE